MSMFFGRGDYVCHLWRKKGRRWFSLHYFQRWEHFWRQNSAVTSISVSRCINFISISVYRVSLNLWNYSPNHLMNSTHSLCNRDEICSNSNKKVITKIYPLKAFEFYYGTLLVKVDKTYQLNLYSLAIYQM